MNEHIFLLCASDSDHSFFNSVVHSLSNPPPLRGRCSYDPHFIEEEAGGMWLWGLFNVTNSKWQRLDLNCFYSKIFKPSQQSAREALALSLDGAAGISHSCTTCLKLVLFLGWQ